MIKSKAKRNATRREPPPPAVVPKLCGADFELGNFIVDAQSSGGTGAVASRALLREIAGVPERRGMSFSSLDNSDARRTVWQSTSTDAGWGDDSYGWSNAQDWGRKFLLNGGCAYIDLDHLELCIPEVLSARDHVAAWHAMLEIGQAALQAANRQRPASRRIVALANNSDGHGHSHGSHLGFLISRDAWERIFHRKFHQLLYLASFQVSSIVLTGQGKVGSENGAGAVDYQIAQRADFFETLVGLQTTYRRPLVNSRDESLCGFGAGARDLDALARLHVIFFDHTLCQVASYLKVGLMQILLAMLEAEQTDLRLVLDDPLDAVLRWSHDPGLTAKARLVSGQEVTAVELQRAYWERMQAFVESGACEGIVPEARQILALADDTLAKLANRDFMALARRLDWVLKLCLIRRLMSQRPGLTWDAPDVKHVDQVYASLDPEEGLYWTCQRGGLVDRLVDVAAVEHFIHQPPEDTRAWTRALLLRRLGADAISEVNWDRLVVSLARPGRWPVTRTLHLENPLSFTRAEVEPLTRSAATQDALLDGLGATRSTFEAAAPLPVQTHELSWAGPQSLAGGGPWVSASIVTGSGLPDRVDPPVADASNEKGHDHGSA